MLWINDVAWSVESECVETYEHLSISHFTQKKKKFTHRLTCKLQNINIKIENKHFINFICLRTHGKAK